MSYQALYRVWRPKTFQDVVGQSHITRTLQNAIVQQKFSHAYLFSGPRGTGKTSAAKIFARAVNCERSPVREPCNECAACRGIQDGSISDVIEIDAASNNSVEQVRDIREHVNYAPSAVKYKVYIIDEVHMLSISAFNALLKTLEEPPEHVIFILATTEPHKIPLTIISRCQRFDFKRISQQAIVSRLKTIVESEGVKVDEEALLTVALAAEGGMRDALSLLDQAISYSENESVSLDDVLAVTGSVSQKRLGDMIQSLNNRDSRESLNMLDQAMQEGKDPGRLVFDFIYYLRDVLLYQNTPDKEFLERAIPDEMFQNLAQTLDADWIQKSITIFNQCQQEMKWTTTPKIFLEIAFLKIVDNQQEKAESGAVSSQLLKRVEQLEKELQQIKQMDVSSGGTGTPSSEPRSKPLQRGKKYKVPYERIRKVLDEASKRELQNIQSQWAAFMDSLKQNSPPAHAKLMNSKPRAASENSLVLSFKYEIHCSLMLENQKTIESLLSEFIGKPIAIIPIPEADWTELREEYVRKQRQQDQGDAEEAEDPVVAEARKLVGDELLDIKD